MRWWDRHAGFVVAAVGVIGSAVTVLAFVAPSSREWMADNGGWLWAPVVVLITGLVWALLNWRRTEARCRSLEAAAAVPPPDVPLPADARLWDLLEQRLPQGSPSMQWLRQTPDSGTFHACDVQPLSAFAATWRAEGRRFLDDEINDAVEMLLAAIDDFRGFQSQHAEWAPKELQVDGDNPTYRIEEIVLREWTKEAAALIDGLRNRADAVLAADVALRERAARKGL